MQMHEAHNSDVVLSAYVYMYGFMMEIHSVRLHLSAFFCVFIQLPFIKEKRNKIKAIKKFSFLSIYSTYSPLPSYFFTVKSVPRVNDIN